MEVKKTPQSPDSAFFDESRWGHTCFRMSDVLIRLKTFIVEESWAYTVRFCVNCTLRVLTNQCSMYVVQSERPA